jgi:hypothetical protein
MKKLFTIFISVLALFLFIEVTPVLAYNTNSIILDKNNSQYLKITDASQTGLDITGDFTIEAWIKLNSRGFDGTIAGKTKWVSFWSGYRLAIDGSSKLDCFFGDSSEVLSYATMNEAFNNGDLGNWIYVAVSVDVSEGANGITFYKNGVAKAKTTGSNNATSVNDTTGAFLIGASESDNPAQDFFDGKIDDVRVWNDIRSAGEISADYQTQLFGNEAGLVGYWKLNNYLTDATSNSNNLTNINGATFSTDVPFDPAPSQHTLTTSATHGTITPDCLTGCLYDEGSEVELTAYPAGGYHFDYWTGGLTGSNNPDSVTMSSDKSVTAHFEADEAPPETIASNLFSVPMASTSDMLASTGTLSVDLWVIIALAIGIPLAFYVIRRLVAIV